MSRHWMYNADRRSQEFMDGVHSLLHAAEANKHNGFMCCPCAVCKNTMEYANLKTLYSHLFKSGFMSNYICWTKHRETGVVMKEGEEEQWGDDDILILRPHREDMGTRLCISFQGTFVQVPVGKDD